MCVCVCAGHFSPSVIDILVAAEEAVGFEAVAVIIGIYNYTMYICFIFMFRLSNVATNPSPGCNSAKKKQ